MSTPLATTAKELPGPGKFQAVGTTLAFQRAPLQFIRQHLTKYGNIFRYSMIGFSSVYVHHPDYIKRILQDHHKNYDKGGPMLALAKPFLGDGLVTSIGGDTWKTRRQLMQPAFHRKQLADIGTIMTGLTQDLLTEWDPIAREQGTVDVVNEMSELALKIVVKSLFSIKLDDDKQILLRNSLAAAQKEIAAYLLLPIIPLTAPTPGHRRFWRNIKIVNDSLYEIIAEYRAAPQEQTDILSMLLAARDPESAEPLNDLALRDELVTMFFAGHETTAKALSWFWYILANNPDIEARVREEIDTVLNGRVPTMADLSQLTYLTQVVNETLRLYAPTWMLSRRAREEDEIGGYRVPKDSEVVWSPYLLHHDPEFWPNPEKVDPDRFLPEKMKTMHKGAYVPFSTGPRICIGNMFAMTEIQLVVAMVMQRYRLELAAPHDIVPTPQLVLVPDQPIRMRLVPR